MIRKTKCLTVATRNLKRYSLSISVIHIDSEKASVHLQVPFLTDTFPDLRTAFPDSEEIRDT